MGFEEDLSIVNNNIRYHSGNKTGDLISNRDLRKLKKDICPEAISYLETIMSFPNVSRILEIGCGQAKAINEFAKKNKNKTFYGLDLALDKFHLKTRANVKLKLGDAHSLDFPDNFIGLTYSFMTFPYILDKLKALKEIYRVLQPNGVAIIDSPPEYFYPSGRKIIPYYGKKSDVFWADFSDNLILINKKGDGVDCLNRKYKEYYCFPWDTCYSDPILSVYE